MKFLKLLAVALMVTVSNAAATARHSYAEIFNGALYYVNTTYVFFIIIIIIKFKYFYRIYNYIIIIWNTY